MRKKLVARFAAITLLVCLAAPIASSTEEIVAFNVRSHKYHCRSCYYAKRCVSNCIEIALSAAIKRGGIACKICGGTCRTNHDSPRATRSE